jgi:hypothetical protein
MYKENIGLWPSMVTDQLKEYLTESSPNQNMDSISNSGRLYSKILRKNTDDKLFKIKMSHLDIKLKVINY